MKNFEFKSIQLDLARQKENIPFIQDFIRFVSDAGYTSVLLYLEDRIRTGSYPYPDADESYSVEEMKDLVKYAQSYNIELIPCIGTLGHAERFLARKELNYLSEVQEGMINRFGNQGGQDVFCISNPDFYPFLEKYMAEIAEIFPSEYFHAGLDEFFNFNLCEKCRQAMPNLAAEEEMFLRHIIRVNDYLNKLGKRMMMWSDMFEIYTTIMPRVPKNVIMVDWLYNEDVRFYLSHLFDQNVEDRIRVNEQLGLTTVMAPAELIFTNTVSCLEYADRKNSWGFLLTQWEKTNTFLYRSYIAVYYCGQLLSGKNYDEAWKNTIKYIFNSDEPALEYAIKMAVSSSNIRHYAEVGNSALFVRPFKGLPRNRFLADSTVNEMLKNAEKYVNSELGRKVFLDICFASEEKCIRNDFKQACWDIFDFGFKDEYFKRAENARQRFISNNEKKIAAWDIYRKDIRPNVLAERKESVLSTLDKNLNAIKSGNFIKLRFCMVDIYVVNYFDVEFLYDGKWQKIVNRNPAKPDCSDALFELIIPVEALKVPEAVRLSVSGMGERNIAYFEYHTADGKIFIPSELKETEGNIINANDILVNSGRYTIFNSVSMMKDYDDPQSNQRFHRVSFTVKEWK